MKLCIALDMANKNDNLVLVKQLKEVKDLWFKVGLRSYIRDGHKLIEDIKSLNSNAKIFLDLKLYDIPNTMADSACEIAKLPIDMFNIHASSGEKAINYVRQSIDKQSNKPLLFTVSALTSFNDESFSKIYGDNINNKIKYFSKISDENGADGMVCSVWESKLIKENTRNSFLTLTPGIKIDKDRKDDQERVADIKDAKNNLSDFIVIGRPIYQAKNPIEVVEQIIKKIKD
jgi:orotidine-5'-phosphate decarboxylase